MSGDEKAKSECKFFTICINHATDRELVLGELTRILELGGCVTSEYAQSVIEREREYPTGVRMEGSVNIALPHAAPENVLVNGIVLGVLDSPVFFREMSNPSNEIPVKLIFVLAAVSYVAINSYIEKLVEEVLLKPGVIQWLDEVGDNAQIHSFIEKTVLA